MPTQEELELQTLKSNSPYALPDDTAASGWTTAQVKEKFYAGLLYLYDLFKETRTGVNGNVASLATRVTTMEAKVDAFVDDRKAQKDWDGNDISQTYAKIANLANGNVPVLKYIDGEGNVHNIHEIDDGFASAIATVRAEEAARDLTAVHKSGNETVSGKKTFNDSPLFKDHITFDYQKGILMYEGFLRTTAHKFLQIGGDSIYKVVYKVPYYGNSFYGQEFTIATNEDLTKVVNGTTVVEKAKKDANGDNIAATYLKKAQIVNSVTSDSSTDPLSAAQGKYLKGLIDAINTLLASDDTTLDELQEVVSYIKTNRDLITAITTSKVNVSDIIDALNSASTDKPLSANQGKVLKGLIDAIHTTLTPTITETYDLGSLSLKYKDLYLSGKVKDGTREMTLANIMEVSNALGTIDAVLDQLNGEVV